MTTRLLLTLCICLLSAALAGQSFPLVKGKILDADSHRPISGATLTAANSRILGFAGDDGYFSFPVKSAGDSLHVTAVGYKALWVQIPRNDTALLIAMHTDPGALSEVIVSTGFQKLPRERATGSFDFIDAKLISRTVSPDFLSRIENLSPGLLVNHGDAASTDQFLIRGRSTIYANARPLIVLDDFPYDGDLGSINPNNIESISVLKDAAAASIWGARAANGVIVITTRQGRTTRPRLELLSTLTWKQRPDLYNVRTISPADFIEAEKSLFASDYYATDEFYNSINYGHPSFTPVVELLRAERDGLITATEADEQINSYKTHDVRGDISHYLYQPSLSQQYALNLSGRGEGATYFLSAGYDRAQASLAGQHSWRLSLLSRNTLRVSKWLSVDGSLSYTQGTQYLNGNQGYNFSGGGRSFYPYARFTGDDGEPADLDMYYNKQFTDTAGQGMLLNWKYSPLRDLHEQVYTITTRDLMAGAGLSLIITPWLSADIRYRYQYQEIATWNLYTDSSFYARNMINNFTRIDFATGSVSYPVPKGGILYTAASGLSSHQGRAQLNIHKSWSYHDISAIAGYEIKHLVTGNNSSGYRYGYDPSIAQFDNMIDYTADYPQYSNVYGAARISSGGSVGAYTDNYLSWYANGAWTLKDRYIFSGSFRRDEANLFGVATNMKGNPLWSAGAAWLLHKEPFIRAKWISQLKLRGTIGYSGNVSRAASAVSTITYFPSAGSTPLQYATILNPPNDRLRWEKVRMINLGVDFEILDRRISGTVEYYLKKAEDLLGTAPVDPTLGVAGVNSPSFFGNLASMKGHGLDMQLNTENIRSRLYWNTTLNLSWAASRVTRYLMPVAASAAPYINSDINPLVGKPLFELFSYPWAGLDPATGAPLGYLNGKPSTDYNGIFNSTPLDSVVDNGNRQPLLFGALRNTLGWKNFSLSFTLSYKFKYYFRRTSVQYGSFAYWTAHADYAKRWQQPGDEKTTSVPSYTYPVDPQRESFYANASVLVEKADNIRLEDINLSYDLDSSTFKKLPFAHLRIFLLATGLGPVWKANKQGIDPYYDNIPLERPSFSAGINLSL